jgi:hypothetical protein
MILMTLLAPSISSRGSNVEDICPNDTAGLLMELRSGG